MFSVIIPLYNKELSVRATIQSVLDQTLSDFEIVVVNDGSTDRSLEIIKQFEDKRIHVIEQPNGGVSSARNKGIKESKYEWIAFLDGDDLWKQDHLETLKKMISHYTIYKVFCTSYILSYQAFPVDSDNSIIVIDDYFEEAIKHHFFWTSVTCIHKAILEDLGGFNTALNRGEDLDLWARIGREYTFVRSKKITAIYRMDAENKTSIGKSIYSKSILSIINLKGLSGFERKYFKRLLNQRIKTDIKCFDIRGLVTLVSKHNLELLK